MFGGLLCRDPLGHTANRMHVHVFPGSPAPPYHPAPSSPCPSQVSAAQLGTLAKLAAGTLDAGDRMSTDEPAGNGAGAGLQELTMEDFRWGWKELHGWKELPIS